MPLVNGKARSRTRGVVLSVCLGGFLLACVLLGAYLAMSVYFGVTGGWQSLLAEASGDAARIRRERGESAPLGGLVALAVGFSVGTFVALRTWTGVAQRLFRLERDDARRVLQGTWNAKSES